MEEMRFTLGVLEMHNAAVDTQHSPRSTYVQNGGFVIGFHELLVIAKEATVPQHHCREDDGHVANALIDEAKPRANTPCSSLREFTLEINQILLRTS